MNGKETKPDVDIVRWPDGELIQWYCDLTDARKIELMHTPFYTKERRDRAHKVPAQMTGQVRASSSLNIPATMTQVGGAHYMKLKIQPVEYIHANSIPFCEGSVIKYVTRWRDKGGVKDLEKARHFINLLIELETNTAQTLQPTQPT